MREHAPDVGFQPHALSMNKNARILRRAREEDPHAKGTAWRGVRGTLARNQ